MVNWLFCILCSFKDLMNWKLNQQHLKKKVWPWKLFPPTLLVFTNFQLKNHSSLFVWYISSLFFLRFYFVPPILNRRKDFPTQSCWVEPTFNHHISSSIFKNRFWLFSWSLLNNFVFEMTHFFVLFMLFFGSCFPLDRRNLETEKQFRKQLLRMAF